MSYNQERKIKILGNSFIKSGKHIHSVNFSYIIFFKFKKYLILEKNFKNQDLRYLFKKSINMLCPTIGLLKSIKQQKGQENDIVKYNPYLLSERQRVKLLYKFICSEIKETNLKIKDISNFIAYEFYLVLQNKGSLLKKKKEYDNYIFKNTSLIYK